MATRIKFQQNLDDLKEKLLVMAGMAEQAIQRSIEAYRTRDLSICEQVFRAEPSINRLEREIDQMALDLLAMEQPMAIDLRFILSVIRINADLERVGDQAVNIAVRVREMGAFANIDLPVDIPKLASLAAAMVRKALQAFIEADADLATSVLALDDQVDEMNDAAFYALSTLIKEQPELTPQSLNALIIARNLERVGDHATNIAEECDFLGPWRGCAAQCRRSITYRTGDSATWFCILEWMAAPQPHPEHSKTNSNPSLLLIALVVIVLAIVGFLVLKPRPSASGEDQKPASAPVVSH